MSCFWPSPKACLAATLAAIACGCASVPGAGLPGAWATVKGQVRLVGAPQQALRPLLQVGPRLFPAKGHEVAWLEVFLTRLDQAGAPELAVGRLPGLSHPIELTQLRPNATYRVRLAAFDDQESRLDDNASHPTDPEGLGACETEVSVGNQAEQAGLSFDLKLQDVAFEGRVEGQVQVTTGSVVTGPEAVSAPAVFTPPGYESFVSPVLLRVEGDLYLSETDGGGNLTVPPNIPGYGCWAGTIIQPFYSSQFVTLNLGSGPQSVPVFTTPDLSRCNNTQGQGQ